MPLSPSLRAYLLRRYATLYQQSVDPQRRWGQSEATFRRSELDLLALGLGYEFVGRGTSLGGGPDTWILRRVPTHTPVYIRGTQEDTDG